MEYFLIWIPGSFAALALLFLLAHWIEKKTQIGWPKRSLSHLIGWLVLVLLWVGMLPFIMVGLLFGYPPAFEPPNERASPGGSPNPSAWKRRMSPE
jgi:hypothetical protein